jgi:hypothetical protein
MLQVLAYEIIAIYKLYLDTDLIFTQLLYIIHKYYFPSEPMLSSNVCGTDACIASKKVYRYKRNQANKLNTKHYIYLHGVLVNIGERTHCTVDAAYGSLRLISILLLRQLYQLQFGPKSFLIQLFQLQFFQVPAN